ncbi:hypothetical protein ABFX02_10G118400 [Erythranthe guttata]
MAYSYTPTYYTSLHDSISSMCKNILPFSFKKKRLPAIAAAEQQLSKLQSDNLKWQQESYHQILNLMGLCKEGILHQNEVSTFRIHLLETLISMSVDYEPPVILRDKLIFLQELLYAKCISDDEYHRSKMPLLQKLADQGAEIKERDFIVEPKKQEWSVIDLKESNKSSVTTPKNKIKEGSPTKKLNGTSSVSGFVTPDKNGKLKEDNNSNIRTGDRNVRTVSFPRSELMSSSENPFWNRCLDEKESESKSILMMETLPEQSGGAKGKRKPFRALFQKDQKEGHFGNYVEEKEKAKSVKKTWGFDGFKKWKKSNPDDETAPLSLTEKSDGISCTEQMEKKLHLNGSTVLPEKMKEEPPHIQVEVIERSAHVHLSGDQTEEISTWHRDADSADSKKLFRKSGGDSVNSSGLAREKVNSKRWTTFDDDDYEEENSHPNLFAPKANLSSSRNARTSINSSIDKGFRYNPFFDM